MSRQSGLVKIAPHADITYRILGAAVAVHNEHGPGHREEFCHQAMIHKMADPPMEAALSPEASPGTPPPQVGQLAGITRRMAWSAPG